MLKKICFILLLFVAYNQQIVHCKENAFASPTNTSIEKSHFLHTVERGETVYAISVMYNVSVESIYELNPGSKEVIKPGETLRIPQKSQKIIFHTILPKETLYAVSKKYNIRGEDILSENPGLSVQTFTIGKTILIPIYKEQSIGASGKTMADESESKINALLKEKPQIKNVARVEIALILPFGTIDTELASQSHVQRFVEYYEGFLMALDSLKRTGVSVKLHVFDSGYKIGSLKSVLEKRELNDVHLIVGGFSEEQISALSLFAKARGIRYVIPFTSKNSDVMNNPFLFQSNPPQSYLYSTVSIAFTSKYAGNNIIFIDMGSGSDKEELVQMMKTDLKTKNSSFKNILYNADTFNNELKNNIEVGSQNIIAISSGTSEALARVITPLRKMREAGEANNVRLFGYPEWQTYIKDYIDDFFAFNTCIYSVFFANNTDTDLKNFYFQFRKWYSKTTINSYPKYALLGYDTGLYFIQMIHRYGAEFENSLNKLKYESLQTGYRFQRTNNWGGFINMNVFWIEYQSDYSINRTEIR